MSIFNSRQIVKMRVRVINRIKDQPDVDEDGKLLVAARQANTFHDLLKVLADFAFDAESALALLLDEDLKDMMVIREFST